MNGKPLLPVTRLTRLFGRGASLVRAVDDVTFGLGRGETITIVARPAATSPLSPASCCA